jgi:ADP-ribosylglycohydrolase
MNVDLKEKYIGAMASAISGAYLGISAISSVWRQKLENRAYIEKLALELIARTFAKP